MSPYVVVELCKWCCNKNTFSSADQKTGTESRSSLDMCLFPLHVARSPFLCRMWRRCRRSTSWTVLKTQRSASGKHPVVVVVFFLNIIWLLHISVFDDVKLVVHAGGCASVWGHIGRKLFPWRWRWLLNRAEWNSLGHSSSKCIHLFWEGPKGTGCYREFCNFLATASNRAHFCFQVSRAHQDHFKVPLLDLLFSFSFSFREVYNFSKYSEEAVKTFKEHRGALHPVTAMLVAKDLKIDG